MNLKKNAQSLSFIIYGLLALSLLILYNGFSTLYGNVLADFIIGQNQDVLIFNLSYGNATALVFVGSLIFFSIRFATYRLEMNDVIRPDNAIRFWLLGGIVLVTSLFAVFDLITIISGVLTGKSESINLLVSLITLLVLLSIFLFCIQEVRRRESLCFFSSLTGVRLIFCVATFVVGFYVAPPWLGRDAREDQKQLSRLNEIWLALSSIHAQDKDLPEKLSDIHSHFVKKRNDILDVVTSEPYEYKKLTPSSYSICGHFLTDYDVYRRYRLFPDKLIADETHHKGKTCYTIDLSLKVPKPPYFPD